MKKMLPKKEMKEYIVAYIDVLGVKDKITSPELLNTIHNLFSEAADFYQFEEAVKAKEKMSIKIFSDNIFIACKIGTDDIEIDLQQIITAFTQVATFSAMLQLKFAKEGLLLRGGITKGELFIDDLLVWGKALLEAYNLENELAYYPRIIVDNMLAEKISTFEVEYFVTQLLAPDFDYFFLDFLNPYLFRDKGLEIKEVLLQKDKLLKEVKDNKKALIKIKWLLRYFEDIQLRLDSLN